VYQIFLAVNFGQLGQLKLLGYMQQAKLPPFSENFTSYNWIVSLEGMLSVKLFI
jgi:hypothetical protein